MQPPAALHARPSRLGPVQLPKLLLPALQQRRAVLPARPQQPHALQATTRAAAPAVQHSGLRTGPLLLLLSAVEVGVQGQIVPGSAQPRHRLRAAKLLLLRSARRPRGCGSTSQAAGSRQVLRLPVAVHLLLPRVPAGVCSLYHGTVAVAARLLLLPQLVVCCQARALCALVRPGAGSGRISLPVKAPDISSSSSRCCGVQGVGVMPHTGSRACRQPRVPAQLPLLLLLRLLLLLVLPTLLLLCTQLLLLRRLPLLLLLAEFCLELSKLTQALLQGSNCRGGALHLLLLLWLRKQALCTSAAAAADATAAWACCPWLVLVCRPGVVARPLRTHCCTSEVDARCSSRWFPGKLKLSKEL